MPSRHQVRLPLSADAEPELWAAVAGAAEATGAGAGSEVFVTPRGDAMVERRRGLRARRRVVVGVGLLQLLDEAGLRATLDEPGRDSEEQARLDLVEVLYASFLDHYVSPALWVGAMPPLLEGFRRFVTAEPVQDLMRTGELTPRVSDVSELLSARPLIELAREPDALERELAAALADAVGATGPRTVSWEDLGMEALAPAWAKTADQSAHAFPRGLRLVDLAQAVEALDEAGEQLLRAEGASLRRFALEVARGQARQRAREALVTMLGTSLVRAGFSLERLPGEPSVCRRGDVVLKPFHALDAMVDHGARDQRWRRQVTEAGLADLPLTE